MGWGWVDGLRQLADDVADKASEVGRGIVETTENVGREIVQTGENIGKEIVKTGEEVISLPGKIYDEFASDKPQMRSYQSAPGRHHNNETVIPDGSANYSDNERQVLLACRFIGGEGAGLVAKLAIGDSPIPNPAYHWCITVGDYLHQLQATSLNGGWNYYTNERLNRLTGGWTYYPIGNTSLNDVAIKDISDNVMNDMPEVYHALDNNCQTFSLRLVDRILTKARTQKFLKANMTYGLQKSPELKMPLMTVEIRRIDTGEVVKPGEVESAEAEAEAEATVQPTSVEEVPAPEVEPVVEPVVVVPVAEEVPVHGEPVLVAGAEETTTTTTTEDQSGIPRVDVLRNVAEIMIQNTPTLYKEDLEMVEEAPVVSAAQVAAY